MRMKDIVSRCTTTYNNSEILAVKAQYNPDDMLEIVFQPGPYFLDCNKIKLLFKLAYTSASKTADVFDSVPKAVAAARPEDLFSLVDFNLNGVRVNDH